VRVASTAILAVATIAALSLIGHPVGLGTTVVLAAVFATASGVRPLESPRLKGSDPWWVLAVALAAVAALRDAAWVVWPALAARSRSHRWPPPAARPGARSRRD
jgi:hypothetical protein